MGTNMTIPGTCRLMRIREVLQLCRLSRATLYREIKLRSFPRAGEAVGTLGRMAAG